MLNFNNPTLVTITAPTCSGKTTLLNALVERGCGRIVSTTTRLQRPGEVPGVDYFFITEEHSRDLEESGEFFELITFNGTRYGVSHQEMSRHISSGVAPVIILEPKGLAIYEQKCLEYGLDIYKIYVHLTEKERVQRLHQRTADELIGLVDGLVRDEYSRAIHEGVVAKIPRILRAHTDRVQSIVQDERAWISTNQWDASVPGNNIEMALKMLEYGVGSRNRQVSAPQAIKQVALPIT